MECRVRRGKEDGSDRIAGSQKLDSASLGVTPAMERMPALILESKSRKAVRLCELGDASQVADPGGDALTDEGKSGPAEAKDGREGSGGFDGDGKGLPLAIFEGSGGAAEDGAAVAFDGESGEPSGWEDGAGRDEKPTLVDAERDASRSEDADGVGGNEIGYAFIDEEADVINKGGGPPGAWRNNHRHGFGFGRREHLEQREE